MTKTLLPYSVVTTLLLNGCLFNWEVAGPPRAPASANVAPALEAYYDVVSIRETVEGSCEGVPDRDSPNPLSGSTRTFIGLGFAVGGISYIYGVNDPQAHLAVRNCGLPNAEPDLALRCGATSDSLLTLYSDGGTFRSLNSIGQPQVDDANLCEYDFFDGRLEPVEGGLVYRFERRLVSGSRANADDQCYDAPQDIEDARNGAECHQVYEVRLNARSEAIPRQSVQP